MRKGRGRVFLAISFFVLVIAILVVFLSYRLLKKSLPKTSGSITLNILERPVEVFRDEYGVPHIFADNENDLFKAAGYVTAQDRLWQMDLNRRAASGRLSEIFGNTTSDNDKFLRLWGFRRVAEEIVKSLSNESIQVLKAYADGVNAFINSHQDRLPIEFVLLHYKPDPWQIEDSIAFGRLFAWRLSFSWYIDLVLQQIINKVGESKAREVFPDFPQGGPFIIDSNSAFWSQTEKFLNSGLAVQNFMGTKSPVLGSNSWVVSGAKSTCGKPLLANDPHLQLTTPSPWYEMHLSGGEINVAGVSLPGAPGVVIGHNKNIAWGMTNGMVDDVDFYVEKINPDSTAQYWDGNTWKRFEVIEEKISIKDADPVILKISKSKNGPIITDFHPVLKDTNLAVSMKWVGHQASDEVLALLKLQKAKNWNDFTEAVRHFRVPAQNITFASVHNNIGYYLAGAIPIREKATGILPHQGWLAKGKWVGEIEFEKQPHAFNPPDNYIATANNKIVDERYPFYISNLWEPPGRVTRIHQILKEKEKLSVEDFKAMQNDITSTHAQLVLPIIIESVRPYLVENEDEKLQMLFDLLNDWDGIEKIESIAVSIFHAFFLKFTENTLKDEMGDELYDTYIKVGNVPFRVMTALLQKETSSWFDNVSTEEIEKKDDIVVKSLFDAGKLLEQIAGNDIGDWMWGEIHQLTMKHPLGEKKPLDFIFNIGPLKRAGSAMTLNNAEYRFDAPFDAVLGPSTRRIVDFCDLSHSYSVLPTGQSGQRMSDHYKDQTELWRKGEYRMLRMDKEEISQTASARLLLKTR